jgi:hypothetical protein
MKNKYSLIKTGPIILTVLLSLTACKKYTEVDPVSQYSIAQAFSDVSNATNA